MGYFLIMNIAILGFGTVGVGVYDILSDIQDITVKYVLDVVRHENITAISTTDFNDIINDNDVDTVVEVIGGLNPAYDFVKSALIAKKNVITANKLLISTYYKELTDLASKNNVALRYTAAVGGGIPWLVNLERALRVSNICEVSGIMNGTSNYILDAMHTEKVDFNDCLKVAQELGYAERDPSADIDGIDTLCKIVLSANIAFSCAIDKDSVNVAGIRYVSDNDIAAAEKMDCVCKLMGYAFKYDDSISVFVEPTFVGCNQLESSVSKNLNLISYEAEHVGRESYYGFGAGRYPTAYNVVEDCVDVAGGTKKAYNLTMNDAKIDNTNVTHKYYVRTSYTNSWFENVKKEAFEKGYIIEDVSVLTMHKFNNEAIEAGKECFIAGISKA